MLSLVPLPEDECCQFLIVIHLSSSVLLGCRLIIITSARMFTECYFSKGFIFLSPDLL